MSEAAVETPAQEAPAPPQAVETPPAAEMATPSTFETMVGGLPEDLRSAPIWEDYKERGFEGLAKDHLNLQSVLGSTERVNLPNENSPPEAWADYRQKMGVPESPDAYDLGDFKPPEGLPWDDARVAKLAEAAHAANIPNSAWKEIIAADAAYHEEFFQAQAAELQANLEKAGTELREKYGESFDSRMELAEQYGVEKWGEDFVNLMNIDVPGLGRLGNVPHVVEMLMDLGQQTQSEDVLEKGAGAAGNPFANLTPATAQAKIEEMNSIHRDLLTSDDAARKGERKAVQAQLDHLYKIVYPGTGNLF